MTKNKIINNDELLMSRCDTESVITKDLYILGITDSMEYLFSELQQMLMEENRYIGIVKSYFRSIHDAYGKIHQELTEENLEICKKILYLFKPSFKSEFLYLSKSRRLSNADAVIVLIHRISNIILNESVDYSFKAEVRTLNKIITRLYNNIRNKGKEAILFKFANNLNSFINSGVIGKYCLDQFSFIEKPKNNPVLTRSGVRVKNDSEDKVIEVTLD